MVFEPSQKRLQTKSFGSLMPRILEPFFPTNWEKTGFWITTRNAGAMITLINNRNYRAEIGNAVKPVLLLCMPKGPDFSDQISLLHQVAEKHKDVLKVCLLEEELINGFRQMLDIKGTPVYLLFCQGKEKGRILGMAGVEQLSAFLNPHTPESGPGPGKGDIMGMMIPEPVGKRLP